MYNEKFLSIHIPKDEQEEVLVKEIKKRGRKREQRINQKWKKDVDWFYNLPEDLQFAHVLQRMEEEKNAELYWCPVLISGTSYISYYPTSARIDDAEKQGESYSKKYTGKVIVCSRFEEMFLIELFEAGEMLSKILWMDSEVAEVLEPQLILGDTLPETLIDEPIDEEDERYWQKEDFEKLDAFLQEKYHIFADEPRFDKLEHLKFVDDSDGIRIYDSSEYFEKQGTSV